MNIMITAMNTKQRTVYTINKPKYIFPSLGLFPANIIPQAIMAAATRNKANKLLLNQLFLSLL
jgi:hypothetical protein